MKKFAVKFISIFFVLLFIGTSFSTIAYAEISDSEIVYFNTFKF